MADDLRTRRIKAFCHVWGVGRYADDAAQEDLTLRAQGKRPNQAAKYAALDALIRLGVFTRSDQPKPPRVYSLDGVEHADALEAQALEREAKLDFGVDEGRLTRVKAALETLGAKHRGVIELILEDKDLKEVGAAMGFTESRACQLKKQAVLKMQKILGIPMETRHCPCGKCPPFRVSTRSNQIYGSTYCQEAHTGEKIKPMKRVAMRVRNEEISETTSAKAGRIMVTAAELAEKVGKQVNTIYYNAKVGKIHGEEGERGTVFDLEKSLAALEKKPKEAKPKRLAGKWKNTGISSSADSIEPEGGVISEVRISGKSEYSAVGQESLIPRETHDRLMEFVASPRATKAQAAPAYSKSQFAKEVAKLARSAPNNKVQLTLLRMAVSLSGLLE